MVFIAPLFSQRVQLTAVEQSRIRQKKVNADSLRLEAWLNNSAVVPG